MSSSQVSPVEMQNGVTDNGSRASATRKEKEWIPYELSFTETAILFPLAYPLRYWVRIRDTIFRNAFLDWRIPFPCWKRLDRLFTWIEILAVIVCCLVVGIVTVVYYTKSVTPNALGKHKDSGKDDVKNSGLSEMTQEHVRNDYFAFSVSNFRISHKNTKIKQLHWIEHLKPIRVFDMHTDV